MVLTLNWSIGWASRSTSGGVPTVIAVILIVRGSLSNFPDSIQCRAGLGEIRCRRMVGLCQPPTSAAKSPVSSLVLSELR